MRQAVHVLHTGRTTHDNDPRHKEMWHVNMITEIRHNCNGYSTITLPPFDNLLHVKQSLIHMPHSGIP
jgi:hypothetical protein